MPDVYDLYDLAHAPWWERYILHDLIGHVSYGLDLYCTDPAQHLIAAG